MSNDTRPVVGIDLGGTNVRAARVKDGILSAINSRRINAQAPVNEVLQDLFDITDPLVDNSIAGIGIGVPSVVDLDTGIVYDVQNIPSWIEVPLKTIMEERYRVPVFVNNDANCFALGEYYFGKAQGEESLIGLTIGTGLGAGIIINRKLYAGANCGAGEFGMVAYLDKWYEYYACGQFFSNVYGVDGGEVFEKAKAGDKVALEMYAEMGMHLGQALKTILYTYDCKRIILGGSVRSAYSYFSDSMWAQLKTFVYPRSVARLQIDLSELANGGLLGAAGLVYDAGS